MQRSIIIIGGGFLQLPLIQTAKDMDLHTVVFDMSADAPGMKMADSPVLMSTRDIDGCVREAKKIAEIRRINGVVTAGTDASRAVAAIAGSLDLPGIRYADAEAASNKVLMRKRLRSGEVPVPDFFSVWSLKEARDAMDELSFPLVLKPADNMGARGVIKVRNRGEIPAAFRHAKKYSPTGEMILEEYMDGPELSVDALAWNGNFRITGIADRIIDREPYFVELGHNMPSRFDTNVIQRVKEVMIAAMKALGIHTGAAKGDIKVTPDGIKIGEVAARLSGGFMSSHTYPYHSGADILRAAIQIALGDEPDTLDETENLVAIERGILGTPGRIIEISGLSRMEAVSGIRHVFFNRQQGDVIPEPTSNIDKVGHIIATGRTLEAAEHSVAEALRYFHLLVDDSFSVDWKQVEQRARARFGDNICWVCKSCDGSNCASNVPGMGGAGENGSFLDNSKALAEYSILPRYIRSQIEVDPSVEMFGRRFDLPLMSAPMTGAVTNMNGAMSEHELARSLIIGSKDSGSIAWLGDGASPDKYLEIARALEDAGGFAIAICKPREDTDSILRRFDAFAEAGALAVGMDIDAISFRTMEMKKLKGKARSFEEIAQIRKRSPLPFILKGIMTVEDAIAAFEAGVDGIVVSNHGGRILDSMPGTAHVLPEIASRIKSIDSSFPVLVDGGVRSGQDIFKMLALGADSVLCGRPMAIAAVGGDVAAVKFLYRKFYEEFAKTMNLCGTDSITQIDQNSLFRENGFTEKFDKDRNTNPDRPI